MNDFFELQIENTQLAEQNESLRKKIDELEKENDLMRKALEIFADDRNWIGGYQMNLASETFEDLDLHPQEIAERALGL